MARNSRSTRTRTRTRNHRGTSNGRVLPWVLLSDATEVARDRPLALSTDDRARLRALVTRAGGRGINLSPRERNELSLLVDRASTRTARSLPQPVVASRRRVVR